jgi:redox-sensitive bicupin YhaK (pirin superfamily)
MICRPDAAARLQRPRIADPARPTARHIDMTSRSVSQVIFAPAHEMGALTVRQPLPSEALPYLDPFVLLHHAPPRDFSGGTGVSWHPHRGFAPVTFIFRGGIRHRDTQADRVRGPLASAG